MIYLHIYLWHFSFISMVFLWVFSVQENIPVAFLLITVIHSCILPIVSFWKCTLSSFMNDIFTEYWILGWHFKDVSPLSAGYHCFFGKSIFEANTPFFLASFKLFSGCLYNFLLCLGFWQFYYDISFSVFFPLLFGFLLVIFFLHAWLFLHKIQKLCVKHCMTV